MPQSECFELPDCARSTPASPRVTGCPECPRNAAPHPRAQADPRHGGAGRPAVLAVLRRRSLIGRIEAGVLLNRNPPLHRPHQRDRLPGRLPFGQPGHRHAVPRRRAHRTNVRLFGADRARPRHPRLSQTVRRRRAGPGPPGSDRAFVVGDWYVSAYEPLVDNAGGASACSTSASSNSPFTTAEIRRWRPSG